MKNPLIVLMTDFGVGGIYTGIMKAVIHSICREAEIIDLIHNIQPQNIKQAAFLLGNSISYFPEETIFVIVVDPGVGSSRKSLVIKSGKRYFVTPDNGLVSYVASQDSGGEVYELTNKEYFREKISSTFHGRDIFAPVAAHLASGIEIQKFGNKINLSDIIQIPPPLFHKESFNCWLGEIIYSDSFGNIITSLNSEDIGIDISDPTLNENWRFEVSNQIIKGLKRTYAEANPGELLAYIGSFGYIEMGISNGNAAQVLDASGGNKIRAIKFS
jgi:S-adenosylmethionine hydrolase